MQDGSRESKPKPISEILQKHLGYDASANRVATLMSYTDQDIGPYAFCVWDKVHILGALEVQVALMVLC